MSDIDIDKLNKKRQAIEAEKQKIADRARERAEKEHADRLAAEGDQLDWELNQLKEAEKAQEAARKEAAQVGSASDVPADEVKRLVAAARAKAAGGTPPKPKATSSGSGGTPTTAAPKNEEK